MSYLHGDAIHIGTEADAWQLLEDLIRGDFRVDSVPTITLGEWAKIEVYIPDDRYDSAITPYMMAGWIDVQRSIYRAYSLVEKGVANANSITDLDKERLQLIVEVKSGSSDQTADVLGLLETFITSAVDKMEPWQVLAVVAAFPLVWAGTTITQGWLANKKEIKLAEIEVQKNKVVSEDHRAALATIAAVSGVDKQRLELIAQVGAEIPVVAKMAVEADKARESLIKHVTKVDAVVNGVHVPSAAGQTVTSKPKIVASDVRLDGLYKIQKVDTTMATGFRVHLVAKGGRELVADVAEVMTTLSDRSTIQNAEWYKLPVFLAINAKDRNGIYTDAIIVRADEYDAAQHGDW